MSGKYLRFIAHCIFEQIDTEYDVFVSFYSNSGNLPTATMNRLQHVIRLNQYVAVCRITHVWQPMFVLLDPRADSWMQELGPGWGLHPGAGSWMGAWIQELGPGWGLDPGAGSWTGPGSRSWLLDGAWIQELGPGRGRDPGAGSWMKPGSRSWVLDGAWIQELGPG